MSLQAGVYYVDERPIFVDEAAMIRNLSADGIHTASSWSSEGVVLASADFPLFSRGAAGAQRYVTSRAVVSFDGRLDNRDELRLLLRHEPGGVVSDAALALAVYLRFGPDGLDLLIGDWSLVIWDVERKRLVLASDFAGVRPLYYYSDAECIVWFTNLKALVEWIGPREIDNQYVAGFLTHGGYPDLTPYAGVFSVRPGHYLTYSGGRVGLHPFWQPPIGTIIQYARESDYEDRLLELFSDAVRCRLGGDAPVLSELSGGLDSSSVVCMAKHLIERGSADPLRFVTLSYERQGSLDKRFYSAVEEWTGFESIHLSTTDHIFISGSDTGGALPAFWSQLHAAVAAEAQRIGARTLLTGSLGDLIMGNWWDDSAQVSGLLRDGQIRAALRQSLAWSKSLRLPVGGILWRALLRLLPASAISSRSDLFSEGGEPVGGQEDSITSAFRARMGLGEGQKFFSRTWMEARPERMKHVRGLMETIELRRLQPPEPLGHIYYTHPYAHRPLVEYMLSIPAKIACGPGEPRRLMRRAFRHFWAPALNGRRSKDSFGGAFLAALRPLVPALMRDVKQLQVVQRGYIDPVNLRSRLEGLTHSLDCNAAQLRRVILLELWLRRRINPPIV